MHTRILVSTVLAVVGILAADLTSAQSSYTDDLMTVYGDIQQVKATEQICSEAFPATKDANSVAVQKWRERYRPFLSEIERRLKEWQWNESNRDQKQYEALLASFDRLYESTKTNFRSRFGADGNQVFLQRCENYPRYLLSDRINLEIVRGEEVTRLREARP